MGCRSPLPNSRGGRRGSRYSRFRSCRHFARSSTQTRLEESGLETASGKPHSSNSFGNKFKSWCVKAGLPQCNCHGLRKIGAVRATEAGASEHELMATFGWDDASMARVYTPKAAQKKLAASGAAKLGSRKNCPTCCPAKR